MLVPACARDEISPSQGEELEIHLRDGGVFWEFPYVATAVVRTNPADSTFVKISTSDMWEKRRESEKCQDMKRNRGSSAAKGSLGSKTVYT